MPFLTTASFLLCTITLFWSESVADDTSNSPEQGPRFNQMQFRGSHNSYHKTKDYQDLFQASTFAQEVLGVSNETGLFLQNYYQHPPLLYQLETQKLLVLELDTFADSQGGKFRQGLNFDMSSDFKEPRILTYNRTDPALYQKGFKVLHIPDLDTETHCILLTDCLKEIKGFMEKYPRHLPITIILQPNDRSALNNPLADNYFRFVYNVSLTQPEKFTNNTMKDMEDEILSVFNKSQIFTPGDLIGPYRSVKEALDAKSWPLLEELRGKILFTLNYASLLSIKRAYLAYKPQKDALMFMMDYTVDNADENTAFIAQDFVTKNDLALILTKQYILRSLPDDTLGKTFRRLNDWSQWGIQMLSSDYAHPKTPEMVQFKKNPAEKWIPLNEIDYFLNITNRCSPIFNISHLEGCQNISYFGF